MRRFCLGLACTLCVVGASLLCPRLGQAQTPAPASVDTSSADAPLPAPVLRDSLLSMDAAAQALRERMRPLLAADSIDGDAFTRVSRAIDSLHRVHQQALDGLLDANGFPTPDAVGRDAMRAAVRLVQRGDSALQAQALPLVEAAYRRGEVDGRAVAVLTDRVRGHAGQPQLYGTQGMIVNGRFVPRPIADSARVDARRDSLGLPPLHVYLQEVRTYYGVQ